MKIIILYLVVVYFCFQICALKTCPKVPINCIRCKESCPENEVLIKSLCGCCYNKCIPKPVVCPKEEVFCKRCIDGCPENQTLVKSPCGCCYDQCVPNTKCPDPPIECLLCHFSCPENQTLEVSPCGCCHNRCVPDQETEPKCSADICSRIRCALPTCENGTTLVEGAGYCGCCPGCVTPEIGDKCYTEVNTGLATCGDKLICCDGICRQPNSDTLDCSDENLCPYPPINCLICHTSCPENETLEVSPCGCCHNRCVPDQEPEPECPADICSRIRCALPTCENGTTLVEGAGYCGCCPGCVTPEVGDKCYTEVNTGLATCGEKLICCDGICRQPNKPDSNNLNCLDENLCPFPQIQCFVCITSCLENETLEESPCGCCHNRCVPDTESECPPDICQRVRCALPKCDNGTILVQGQTMCGCCPGCVKPRIGDECYTDFDTGLATCGNKLLCCNGRCQRKSIYSSGCLSDTCRRVFCPFIPARCRNSDEIILQREGQCCPSCVKPSPGDRCYIDPSTKARTCGPDLKCCPNGICIKKTALCIYYET